MAIRFRMGTATEVRRVLTRVASMVANGELEAKDANSIIAACNAVLNEIKTEELQKRIDQLEETLIEYEKGAAEIGDHRNINATAEKVRDCSTRRGQLFP